MLLILLCGKYLEKYVKGCKWRFMREGGAQGRKALRCKSHTPNGISGSTLLMRTICQFTAGPLLHKNGGLIRARVRDILFLACISDWAVCEVQTYI